MRPLRICLIWGAVGGLLVLQGTQTRLASLSCSRSLLSSGERGAPVDRAVAHAPLSNLLSNLQILERCNRAFAEQGCCAGIRVGIKRGIG